MKSQLEKAWQWRKEQGLLDQLGALRIFHGAGEGQGALEEVAIDRFGNHAWVTSWNKRAPREVIEFLRAQGFESAVELYRAAKPQSGPDKGKSVPDEAILLFGKSPAGRFSVSEDDLKFLIQLQDVRHPGLFLDHQPLRRWLRARAGGMKVLNTFAYTGSLSVAAGVGGASHVTTLDLSGATVKWAEENWGLNELAPEKARWISGDVFEWLPRLKREGKIFDCVILDPPSFSRGKKGNFSTAKDLKRLHELALALLGPGGVLITSINSAGVSVAQYQDEVLAAARGAGAKLQVLGSIDLPESFPTRLGDRAARYLKGWIFRWES